MLTGFVVLVVALAPYKAALPIGVPWLLGMASLVAVNPLQHDGCDPTSLYAPCRQQSDSDPGANGEQRDLTARFNVHLQDHGGYRGL